MKRFIIAAAVMAGATLLNACADGADHPFAPQFNQNEAVCDNDDPQGLDPEQFTKIDGSGGASGAWGSFSFDPESNTLIYNVTAGYTLHLCIKAGQNQYNEDLTGSGTYTTPGDGPQGQSQNISHVSWKISGDVEAGPQWCSPGFWRNNPLRVAQTGINMSSLYSMHFVTSPARSPQGVRSGAPVDPTLQQVLDHPQWYGGGAFNNVGDLLSANHPDLDFEMGDMRTEDSCPLSADASGWWQG